MRALLARWEAHTRHYATARDLEVTPAAWRPRVLACRQVLDARPAVTVAELVGLARLIGELAAEALAEAGTSRDLAGWQRLWDLHLVLGDRARAVRARDLSEAEQRQVDTLARRLEAARDARREREGGREP